MQHSSAGLVRKAAAGAVALQHDVVLVLYLQAAGIAAGALQGFVIQGADRLRQLLHLCLKPGLQAALCCSLQAPGSDPEVKAGERL